MRNPTVSLLAGLMLSVGLYDPAATLAVSDQPGVAQSGLREDAPPLVYTPPRKLTPRARVGGGLRGTDGTDPVLEALVPDHVGLTIKKSPILNWFLSKPTEYPLKFTLIDTRSFTPIHEGVIPSPDHEGVQSIKLSDWNLVLEPDVQYRWYVSAIRDQDSPSKDIVVGGIIERSEFNTSVVEMQVDLSCNQQSIRSNAASGFWYDAVSCLCDLITTNPQDASFRRMRAGLLKQVGLNGVAEWDLKSAQIEK
jgi:hypothetical protein